MYIEHENSNILNLKYYTDKPGKYKNFIIHIYDNILNGY
jgi:hypothetical protein